MNTSPSNIDPELWRVVERLREKNISTKRFTPVHRDKKAFVTGWQLDPFDVADLPKYQGWGIGAMNRFFLIDADTPKMAEIIRAKLPATHEIITPRRQLPQFYFDCPDGEISNDTLFLEGEDGGSGEVRAQNHYGVAPGTEIDYVDLKTGEKKTGKYKILHDRPIATVKKADFDKFVEPYRKTPQGDKLTTKDIREGVGAGERHIRALQYVERLYGTNGLDEATTWFEVQRWNRELCRPPLSDKELRRQFECGIKFIKSKRQASETGKPHDPTKYFTKKENGKINKFVPGRLAEDIKRDFHLLTMRDNEEIYVYKDGIYQRGGEVVIKAESRKRLSDELAREGFIYETVAHIKETTYVDRDEFDNPYNLIAVENGLLDVLTGEIQEHSPDKRVLTKIPVLYDKNSTCPVIMKFLKEIHNEVDIPIIQEGVGYCLLKKYPIAKAFMLLGPGENGKSTLLSLIEAFLGDSNVATPSLQDLLTNRFSKAELYGKLVNIHADIPSTTLEKTGAFKMLTGQDTLYMERKNKDPFYGKNYAKLWYSANELPLTTDLTLAFFRRWVLIRYPNSFPEGGPDTDPHIMEKLTTHEELSGFLNWALEGLRRLLKQGCFTTTKTREEIETEWIMKTDSLRAFTAAFIAVEVGKFTTKLQFFERYKKFCVENDLEVVTMAAVGHRLPTIIPQAGASFQPKVGGKQVKAWKDIYITDNADVNSYYPTNKPTDGNNKGVTTEKNGIIGNTGETPRIEESGEVVELPLDIQGTPSAFEILTTIDDGSPCLTNKIPKRIDAPPRTCLDSVADLDRKGYLIISGTDKPTVKITEKGRKALEGVK